VLGILAEDRELLTCPGCDHSEHVAIDGHLFTYARQSWRRHRGLAAEQVALCRARRASSTAEGLDRSRARQLSVRVTALVDLGGVALRRGASATAWSYHREMSVLSSLVDMLHHASRVEPARLERWLRGQPLAENPHHLIDQLVAALDADLGRALDAIYSEPRFQELERNWRSLHLIVDRLARIPNLGCEILSCSLEDLLLDFEDAPETCKAGLFKITHNAELLSWCGRPYAAIITSYRLGDDPRHLQLLRQAGETGAACSMPFVTHGTAELYASAAWDAFRETPEARFIVMMEGEYLLRPAFEATRALSYEQPAELGTWGQGSALLAITMGLSFWRYRLAVHAFQAFEGWVDKLPALEGRTARRMFGFDPGAVIAQGANPIVDIAAGIVTALSLRTAAKPVLTALPHTPEENLELNTQLSALFLGGRLVQYMHIVYRGQIGTWKTREEIAAELTAWLGEQAPGLLESFQLSLDESHVWTTADAVWRDYELRLVLRPVSGVGSIVISNELRCG
jgi:type VI secretion system protein ImpC